MVRRFARRAMRGKYPFVTEISHTTPVVNSVQAQVDQVLRIGLQFAFFDPLHDIC
jgi:hypothetical protein